MSTKLKTASPAHEAAYQDIVDLLKKHAADLEALEMLAVASNLVGKLIAMQDQREVTPAMALQVVSHNIELGNQQAMAQVQETKGSA
jgi:hypothetical protein